MARYEMELRNLPRQRILEYLVEAGGERTESVETPGVTGPGWSAWLEEMPPAQITVMTIRRDMLVIEGDDAAVQPVYDHMRQRTMRGGG